MVERERQREDAAARHQTVGRLQPDDAAGAGRDCARCRRCRCRAPSGTARPPPRRPIPTTSRPDDGPGSTGCAPAATAGRSWGRRSRIRASTAFRARSRRRRAALRRIPRRRRRHCRSGSSSGRSSAAPATSMMSLMPTGTPCRGPRGRPAAISASAALRRRHCGIAVEPDEHVELRVEPLDARPAAPASARPARVRGRRSPAPPRRP